MKVLVTGCAGFIGSVLCERLIAEGHSVIGIDNFDPFYNREIKENNLLPLRKNALFQFYNIDIRSKEQLDSIQESFEVVIHIAAKAGVRPSIVDPGAYIKTNIDGTLNILELMRDRGVNKIVFASSSSVYGDRAVSPYKEEAITDFPISPYAFTKKSAELLLFNYYHLYRLNSVSLRFFTVYGPRQRPDLAIHKFFKAIINEIPIVVYGDGNTSRDYTYITDTVDGIIKATEYILTKNNVCEIFNLGNNNPTTLKDLVQHIEQAVGKRAIIQREGMQQGDVMHTCADISKAQIVLGYNPQTRLADGLANFYQWIKEGTLIRQ